MNTKDTVYLEKYAPTLLNHNGFNEDAYIKHNVKRGLRNEDGSGVVVGLTNIGDVHGYIMDEGIPVPVEGRLRYRGISVTDIVKGFQAENRHGYEEVCFLLLFGHLPNRTELADFCSVLGSRRMLPDNFNEDVMLTAPSPDIMNKLASSVLALYAYDEDAENRNIENIYAQCVNLIAIFPTLVAYAYQGKRHNYNDESLYIHRPSPQWDTAENFLNLIRPSMSHTPLESELLDLCLVLHAEHGGGNNSAFTIRVVSSTDTDTYSAVAAAIGSLKGSRHGGASIKAMEMMNNIKSNVTRWDDESEVAAYLEKIVKKQAFDGTGLIYGIGHAVYTLSDPRAVLLKERLRLLAAQKERADDMAIYELVERLAPLVFAKVKNSTKKVAANVDFYSGFVYSLLGISEELYTPIFAVSRIAGWCAHRIEEIIYGGRIIRPAYRNVSQHKEYVAIDRR
ncbi:MAG: citrate/2-methylcitrate synthase [Spirochaetales bacterium]|nr:citrate/2-methylcitrate synthase [Spirochaetales bacterium]